MRLKKSDGWRVAWRCSITDGLGCGGGEPVLLTLSELHMGRLY